ncbi:bifunctional lysylphosphatidylglycerol flippase/synthetase MprF [Algihabitans albus]|uniref:bifunctional lysylphosphatidylglycerol flippase/synthetase MprF n=1 Tax=Algihabitans albus TaxID=2164067 RepID=UPI000E5D1F6E|nr:phosphatidylglycerol lysyltransferase domain-containing protein [Algihabitans albus]
MSDSSVGRGSNSSTEALWVLTRTAFAGLCLLLALYLLRDRFQEIDLDATLAEIAGVSLTMVVLGIALTALSYLAIASYDLLAFRLMGRPLPVSALLRSGFAATAMGQALGFGVVVGGLTRWRMLRGYGVTPRDAAAASALVASGFFMGLTVVFAVMTLLASDSVATIAGVSRSGVIAGSLLALAIYGLLLSLGGVELSLFGRSVALPDRTLMLRQTGLAALDVIPAGLALWAFLPGELEAGVGFVLTAYIAALAAGLLANTPGGLGAFEGVLLIALPDAPMDSLLAGILCFRMVYYGLPFCLGLLLLTDAELGGTEWRARRKAWPRPPMAPPRRKPSAHRSVATADDPALIARAFEISDRAESNLAFLGDKRFFFSRDKASFVMFGQSGRTLVALGDPVGRRDTWPALIAQVRHQAAATGARRSVFYKIGPEAAAICRAQGLRTARIGHEAVLDLATFDLAGSSRRDLRRKTRQAAKSGVEILRHAPGEAPFAALAEVAGLWRDAKRGRERSFSTGHFDPAYLARFPVFEARRNGQCCAFVSVWISGDGSEWALDLMRARCDVPGGTMHALVAAAALAAKQAGALRFNLCMAPLSGLEESSCPVERLGSAVYRHGGRFHSLQGLRQFKSTFRPDWEPRYLAHRPGPALIGAAFAAYRLCRKTPEVAPAGGKAAEGAANRDIGPPGGP